ncbi:hypothetical protein KP509_09G067400 [Ceratopteris richardii]|uniref:Uncharacterized protein n=1 Tax=Ceratopteris richardii TaxID=49495 RepID=A0A8T2U5K8_CERRI|nr:hypothetical protein KP509_09G067400 [Ceratopteris richardii]
MRPASLLDLCMQKLSGDLVSYHPADLSNLPSHLAEELMKRVLRRQRRPPLLHELLILCQAFWRPASLSLHNHPVPLSSHSLFYLSHLPSIVRLDLSGNAWLDSLEFLPRLLRLECLNLRNCWRLPEQTLGNIAGLSRLRCLDLGNVYSLTDLSASAFIPGIASLRFLNLSGTGVSDSFLNTLTYGQRLRAWLGKDTVPKSSEGNPISPGSIECMHDQRISSLLEQWKPLELSYVRLQHTNVTEAALPSISAFEQLLLLDVRDTEISGRSLKSIQARDKLIALPNNGKILARSNTLIVATLQGRCGCSSMELNLLSRQNRDMEWNAPLEEEGIKLLLSAASRHTFSGSRMHA